jgi:ParB family chromosome partitioning protein
MVRRLRGPHPTAQPADRPTDPNLAALEDRLRVALGSRVRILRSARGGTLEVSFFSEEDLTRLVDLITGDR